MLYVQTTVYNVHKAHLFCTQILYLSKYNCMCNVQTIYRKHVRCILCVQCVYSVFDKHYKYIVEVLGKTIKRTGMIDHSFERKFHGACYRPCFTIFDRLILINIHDNSKTQVLIFSKKVKYIPKTKKFDCLGRGDLTLLFYSKVVKQIEVRGDLSSTVENKESFTSRPSAWENYASALVLCPFKNSK